MIFLEKHAGQVRCCGPAHCGMPQSAPAHPDMGVPDLPRWCIGSTCAAWRWARPDNSDHAALYGSCGLAGRIISDRGQDGRRKYT